MEASNNVAKKTQEQRELFKALEYLCDHIIYGGGTSPVDFRSYVFCTIFYRFLSEDIASYIDGIQHGAGDTDFSYADISDEQAETVRREVTEVKGYFILPSELFCNLVARAEQDNDINLTITNIFANITNSSKGYPSAENFEGLFDSFNIQGNGLGANLEGKKRQIRLLLEKIGEIDFGDTSDMESDILGDAYEFLMSWYAAHAGKKGGQFFTPSCVSELLARLALAGRTTVNKVYDMACGSGSLLLKANKVLGHENIISGFYGQELDFETERLCRMNMFMHKVPYNKFCIRQGDTLTNPRHSAEQPFECIVANPPYSVPWDGDSNPILINDERFSPAGVLAPKSKADFAFIMHALSYLAANGTAAIVCFPGIMYRGGAEKQIRKYLIDNNFVDAVIHMPEGLFYSTSITVDLLILKKSRTTNDILFINAGGEYTSGVNQNILSGDNQNAIFDMYINREDVEYKAKVAAYRDVVANDYNLSVSTYVEAEDKREKVDITALNTEIAEIVAKEEKLRADIDRIVAEIGVQ